MNNDYNKILNLVSKSMKYINPKKEKPWIRKVTRLVLENNREIEVTITALELLEENTIASIILDEIYSTRLPLKSIHNILMNILEYSFLGPSFIKEIYKDYMTQEIKALIEKFELENRMDEEYKKQIKIIRQ